MSERDPDRDAFEAHIRREFPTATDELLLGRSKSGTAYASMVTEHAWRAFKAGRAVSNDPAATRAGTALH